MYSKAMGILNNQRVLVDPSLLALSFGERGLPMGMSILIQYKSHKVLLSANHVADSFKRESEVRMLYKCDHISRHYSSKETAAFQVKEWDPAFDEKLLKTDILTTRPKDLAVIIPAPAILNEIGHHRHFYQMPAEMPVFQSNLALMTVGCLGAKLENNVLQGLSTVCSMVPSIYQEFPDCDYIVCRVETDTYESRELGKPPVASFEGLSGSGLWAIGEGMPQLLGVAFSQDLDYAKGTGEIYFHGPKSVYSALDALLI